MPKVALSNQVDGSAVRPLTLSITACSGFARFPTIDLYLAAVRLTDERQ